MLVHLHGMWEAFREGDVRKHIWQPRSAIFDCETGRGASGASLNYKNGLVRDNG